MDSKINFLILDEPTNHLDLGSREWIEEAVEDFEGTLLFVSHDRYFIDRFANRIWTLEQGTIQDFRGDYTAYQAMRERMKTIAQPPPKEPKKSEEQPVQAKVTGGTKLLKKDLASVEKKLKKAEDVLSSLATEKEEHSHDYQVLEEIMAREEAAMQEYETLFVQWEEISKRLELAQANES